MSQKLILIWTALIGLPAVLLLVLLGRDPDRASSSGPRWKQRIFSSGMILLAALGLLPSCRAPSDNQAGTFHDQKPGTRPGPAAQLSPGSRRKLRKTSAWDSLVATYRKAEAVAQKPEGSYPFDRAGKKKLLADINEAVQTARGLAESGRITKTEANLLVAELSIFRQRVVAFRPKEMRTASCYEPRLLRPIDRTKNRLNQRLTALDRLKAQKTIHPEVLALVRADIEKDLTKLDQLTKSHPAGDKTRAFLTKVRRIWKSLQERTGRRQR